jgi:hypothetical protein
MSYFGALDYIALIITLFAFPVVCTITYHVFQNFETSRSSRGTPYCLWNLRPERRLNRQKCAISTYFIGYTLGELFNLLAWVAIFISRERFGFWLMYDACFYIFRPFFYAAFAFRLQETFDGSIYAVSKTKKRIIWSMIGAECALNICAVAAWAANKDASVDIGITITVAVVEACLLVILATEFVHAAGRVSANESTDERSRVSKAIATTARVSEVTDGDIQLVTETSSEADVYGGAAGSLEAGASGKVEDDGDHAKDVKQTRIDPALLYASTRTAVLTTVCMGFTFVMTVMAIPQTKFDHTKMEKWFDPFDELWVLDTLVNFVCVYLIFVPESKEWYTRLFGNEEKGCHKSCMGCISSHFFDK